MKNITSQKVVNILHQITGPPSQLTLFSFPSNFPYYHPTGQKNIFYKIDSRVNSEKTEGEIFIGLVCRTDNWEKILAQATNTRHRTGISQRVREKINSLKKLVPEYANLRIHGNAKFPVKIVK